MLGTGASAVLLAAGSRWAPAARAEDGANPVTGTDAPLTLAEPTDQEGVRPDMPSSGCRVVLLTYHNAHAVLHDRAEHASLSRTPSNAGVRAIMDWGVPRPRPRNAFVLNLKILVVRRRILMNAFFVVQFLEVEDVLLAYKFSYPVFRKSGKPVPIIFSRRPERYSSAAPLTADARQRIVCRCEPQIINFLVHVDLSRRWCSMLNLGAASAVRSGAFSTSMIRTSAD